MKADFTLIELVKPSTEQCVEGKAHCFHNTGQVQLTAPPQYPQVCCQCNTNRTIGYRPNLDEHEHGEFHPDATAKRALEEYYANRK